MKSDKSSKKSTLLPASKIDLPPIQRKSILVLGGSTFMGLELLKRLVIHEENYEVVFINRGKSYWNQEVKKIKNAIHLFGNRKEKIEYQRLIEYESKKRDIIGGTKKWVAVFDFCAFKYSEVKVVYDALKGKTELYLFISTDSIYDACDLSARKDPKVKEEAACRPTSLKLIEKLKEKDGYAHNKLKCEEYLYNFIEREQFPFIILRLPDVIGPYDDTGRMWAYFKWINNYSNIPILIDDETKDQPMSFVFSKDVAKLCIKLISMNKERIFFNSFNIAFNENITLYYLLNKIGDFSGKKNPPMKESESASKFYPSVDCGPIDTSKAKEILGWNPTPIDYALKDTVEFFKSASGKYKEEEKYSEKKLMKKLKTE